MLRLRVSAAVLGLLLVQGGAVAVPATGDFDGDGKVSVVDVVGALRAAAGITALDPGAAARADLTGDGQVGIGDVVRILRIVAGIDPAAPSFVAAIPYSLRDPGQPDQVTIYVKAVPGAVDYRLYRSDGGSLFWAQPAWFNCDPSGMALTNVTVPLDRATSFRVTAMGRTRESAPSESIVCKPHLQPGQVGLVEPSDGAAPTPRITWAPVPSAEGYWVELRQVVNPIRLHASIARDPVAGVTYDRAHAGSSLVPWAGELVNGSVYEASVSALDSDHWGFAYGSKRFTVAQRDPSLLPGPFTGRWYAPLVGPKPVSGGLGITLEQWGDQVRGTLCGYPLFDVIQNGNTLTGLMRDDYIVGQWKLVFSPDRSTAEGSLGMDYADEATRLRFSLSRQSVSAIPPDPSPPRVLSTLPADGTTGVSRHLREVRITWSRPVMLGDLAFRGTLGGQPCDLDEDELGPGITFDAESTTFTLHLAADVVLDADTQYRITLTDPDWLSWFDADGVAAWPYPSQAYSFSFTTGAE